MKPQDPPPYPSLATGLFFLILGIASEILSRPVQPITYVPGLAFVPLGAGIGLALLERRSKAAGAVGFALALVAVFVYQTRAATSILPFALLVASYSLTRFGLHFYRDGP
ncbi:MAG TPA: hypothetical protein VGE01_02785 [Fimbriimonas sp.]